MPTITTQIGKSGRIVIPANYRKALGLMPGDTVVLALEGEEVRMATPRQAVKRAQALVGRYIPRNRALADELIRDRRAEVRREARKRRGAARRT